MCKTWDRLRLLYILCILLQQDLLMQLGYAQWQPGHAPSWWQINTVKGMPIMSHGAQADQEKHEPADLVDDHKIPSSTEAYLASRKYTSVQYVSL